MKNQPKQTLKQGTESYKLLTYLFFLRKKKTIWNGRKERERSRNSYHLSAY